MKKILFIALLFCVLIGCNKNCDNEYDDCCNGCYEYYQSTGYSTECYSNCWDEYTSCQNDPTEGCFVNIIN